MLVTLGVIIRANDAAGRTRHLSAASLHGHCETPARGHNRSVACDIRLCPLQAVESCASIARGRKHQKEWPRSRTPQKATNTSPGEQLRRPALVHVRDEDGGPAALLLWTEGAN